MANTYTQLYIQIVFAVKFRESLIREEIREEIQKYISGIVQNNGHKMLAIYCMPDHVHIFIGLNPRQSISDCVRDIKANSSKWINERRLTGSKFHWQEGYGSFSYSNNHLDRVVKYVLNQPEHHRQKSFREEYHEFLEKFEIEYREEFLFNWLE